MSGKSSCDQFFVLEMLVMTFISWHGVKGQATTWFIYAQPLPAIWG